MPLPGDDALSAALALIEEIERKVQSLDVSGSEPLQEQTSKKPVTTTATRYHDHNDGFDYYANDTIIQSEYPTSMNYDDEPAVDADDESTEQDDETSGKPHTFGSIGRLHRYLDRDSPSSHNHRFDEALTSKLRAEAAQKKRDRQVTKQRMWQGWSKGGDERYVASHWKRRGPAARTKELEFDARLEETDEDMGWEYEKEGAKEWQGN